MYFLLNRSGGSTHNIDRTFVVNLPGQPANGIWRLRVSDIVSGDTGFIDAWTLDLAPAQPPCSAKVDDSERAMPVPDLSTVEYPVTIAGCSGNGLNTSVVYLWIQHRSASDLVVSLVAPDGSVYLLQYRSGVRDIDGEFVVDLSSEQRNGTWLLRVQDVAAPTIGSVAFWKLTL